MPFMEIMILYYLLSLFKYLGFRYEIINKPEKLTELSMDNFKFI
jgi:hypothetical protein